MTPDVINASFEALGGLLILNNCRLVLRDKAVPGVSVVSTAFFSLWGLWNLFYYPQLGQWWSLVGGIILVCANVFWVALLVVYRSQPRKAAQLPELLA